MGRLCCAVYTFGLIALPFAMAAVCAQGPPSSVVGLYHFDEGGGQWVSDASGAENHGALGSTQQPEGRDPRRVAEGKAGTALALDGKSFVQVPHHPALDLQDELTIDCRVKQTKRSPYARIVEKNDWTYGLWINQDGGADFFYRPESGGANHILSDARLPLNRWVHIRAEFDGLEGIIYFDGKEVAREPITEQKQRIAKSGGDLFIGSRRDGDRGFIGLIDEVRISNTVRRERPPLQICIGSRPSKGTLTLRVNTRGTRGKAVSACGTISAEDGRIVQKIDMPDLHGGMGQATADASGLAPGTYTLSITALDAGGRNIAEERTKFAKPAKPVWLGDEERGLCWFAEDQEAWGLDPEKPGIEAVPDGGVVRLRVYFINAKTKLSGPREFTWGLMGTPVKPRPKGWERWRFGSPQGAVTIGVRWSTLQSSRWHSFPVPPDPKAYHADVKQTHDEGKKFVPYTNFNMQSDTGPEWTWWGDDWNARAGEGKAADVLAMNVVNVRCCAMTPSWCDFIAWKYKTFLDEYDSDGFYLDNSSPGRCNNAAHPPEHHRGRHIFAARELMKRFYTVTKQNDPGNVMVCHMSSTLCIPVLSFCDAIVDGEQYGWALKESFDAHYIPVTPLARVRAELMARQWGPTPFFLPCNRGPNPWTPKLMREFLALMLPHGMRFWLAGDTKTMTRVLDVVDAFDLPNAKFVPYWTVPTWRQMADEQGLVVSAYAREGKAMFIISNLRDQPRDATIDIGAESPGIDEAAATPRDPLDSLPVRFTKGTLDLSIDGRDLRVILLSPGRE